MSTFLSSHLSSRRYTMSPAETCTPAVRNPSMPAPQAIPQTPAVPPSTNGDFPSRDRKEAERNPSGVDLPLPDGRGSEERSGAGLRKRPKTPRQYSGKSAGACSWRPEFAGGFFVQTRQARKPAKPFGPKTYRFAVVFLAVAVILLPCKNLVSNLAR
jgi:hypothetical protein